MTTRHEKDDKNLAEWTDPITPREGPPTLPGQSAAMRRLNLEGGDPARAFKTLDLGFDGNAAGDFLTDAIKAVAKGTHPRDRGRVLTMVLAFAIIAVEADREKATEDRIGPDPIGPVGPEPIRF